MEYRSCGKSGLKLPVITLGLWHNFGRMDSFERAKLMLCHAFDKGVTHFDLANNYGPPAGSAEETFGTVMRRELSKHRDEIIVSSKAGHFMWEGPYGDGGSRKSIMANINQSLKRTGLEYFDIFYSHRYDPETPIEETMMALVDIVRQGKALYIGLSKYPYEKATEAFRILKENKVPCLIYQDRYNMLNRKIEGEMLDLVSEEGSGFIGFSPLAQGILTDKYINGIPLGSRASKANSFLNKEHITEEIIEKVKKLNIAATQRVQSLAQMALAWALRDKRVTSVIVGASSVEQLQENLEALNKLDFTESKINQIDEILR